MPRRRDYTAVMKPRKHSNKLNVSLIFSTGDAEHFKSDQEFSDVLSACSRSTTNTDTLQSGLSLISSPRTSPASSLPTTPTTSPSRSYPPTPTTPPDSYFQTTTPRSSVNSRGEGLYDSLEANHEASNSDVTRTSSSSSLLGAPADQAPLLDPTTPTNQLTFEYRQASDMNLKHRTKEGESVMRPHRDVTLDKSGESPFSRIRATNLSQIKRKTSRRLSSEIPVMTPRRQFSSTGSSPTSPPSSRPVSECRQDPLKTLDRLDSRGRKLSDSRSQSKRLSQSKPESEKRSHFRRESRKFTDSRTDSNKISGHRQENNKPPESNSIEQPIPPLRSTSRRASETTEERIAIGRPINQNSHIHDSHRKDTQQNGDDDYIMTRRDSKLIYNDFEEMEALLQEKEALEANLERERQEKQELERIRTEQEQKQNEMQGTIKTLEEEIVNVDCEMVKLRIETEESDTLEDRKRGLQARLVEERGKQRQYDDLISVSGMSIYSENGLMLNQDMSDYTKRELLESVRNLRKEKGDLEKTIKQLRCDSANERRKQDKVIKDLMGQIRGFHMPVQRSESSGPQETMALITDMKFQLEQLKSQNKSQTKLIERLVTERNHHLVEMARLKGNIEESIQLKEEVS